MKKVTIYGYRVSLIIIFRCLSSKCMQISYFYIEIVVVYIPVYVMSPANITISSIILYFGIMYWRKGNHTICKWIRSVVVVVVGEAGETPHHTQYVTHLPTSLLILVIHRNVGRVFVHTYYYDVISRSGAFSLNTYTLSYQYHLWCKAISMLPHLDYMYVYSLLIWHAHLRCYKGSNYAIVFRGRNEQSFLNRCHI